jgi:hypothetical protein
MSLSFRVLAYFVVSRQARSRGGETRETVSPPSSMTVPPTEGALNAFDVDAFLVCVHRGHSKDRRSNPGDRARSAQGTRMVHFGHLGRIVYVRACRRVFELRHVRLRTGYRRELLPGSQAPALGQGVAANSLDSPRKGARLLPHPQRAGGRNRVYSSSDRLIPRHDHKSIFPASAFRVRIYRWKKCSTQSRPGWPNLVSSIPGSGCRRSDPDPLGCATPSPSEGNAPAEQGA